MKKSFLFNCSSVGTAWDLIHDSRRKRMQTTISMAATTVPRVAYPYKTRDGGATVTIFVPYNCHNHCPFCINKAEYEDMTGFSEEAICRSIRLMDSITPSCDFVFTGGEPFADMESLQRMLDCIPVTHKSISTRHFRFLRRRRKTISSLLHSGIGIKLRASTFHAICSIMWKNRMISS